MENIVLYGTSACHLCEVAEKLLVSVLSGKDYTKSDIAFSQELFERYGEVIIFTRKPKQICDGKSSHWCEEYLAKNIRRHLPYPKPPIDVFAPNRSRQPHALEPHEQSLSLDQRKRSPRETKAQTLGIHVRTADAV